MDLLYLLCSQITYLSAHDPKPLCLMNYIRTSLIQVPKTREAYKLKITSFKIDFILSILRLNWTVIILSFTLRKSYVINGGLSELTSFDDFSSQDIRTCFTLDRVTITARVRRAGRSHTHGCHAIGFPCLQRAYAIQQSRRPFKIYTYALLLIKLVSLMYL